MGKPPNLKKKYAMSHAIATPTAREHITPMLFRYHRFAHAAEAVDQEIRCILAGERTTIRRLQRLIRVRDHAFAELEKYLRHTTAHILDGDQALARRLAHKAEKIRAAGAKPIIAFDEDE